ncbi:hypothetical protein AB1N83_006874 [Pleurotus pulmonarius]
MVRWHTNPAPKLDTDVHIRSRPRLYKKPHYNICLDHELGVLSHHSRIISPLNALPASLQQTINAATSRSRFTPASDVPPLFTQFSTTDTLSGAQVSKRTPSIHPQWVLMGRISAI